ncbi:MAG: pyrroline-5-carboxylate reductase [Phycisphaerales bacterium]
MHSHLVILGGGNMASAILAGGLRAGALDPSRVAVAERDPEKHGPLEAMGARVFGAAAPAIDWMAKQEGARPGQVLVAVKPQSFPDLAAQCGEAMGAGRRVVISIMAGVRSSRVRTLLSGEGRTVAVVRAMPNLPAQIGEGATAVCLGSGAVPGDEAFAMSIFRGVGPLVLRTDETMMDAFTALAGSGPAYLYYLAEGLITAGEKMGFTPEQARGTVAQTLKGAAELLSRAENTPAQLRSAVTSKGGTTQAATEVLDQRGVMGALVEAVRAAESRGQSLGAG